MEENTFLSLGILSAVLLGIVGAYVATKYKPNSFSLIANLVIGAVGGFLFETIIALGFGALPPILGYLLAFTGGFIAPLLVSKFK
jgi:uncharacterized membrane protein YeaQ/YmgE (transglycosylase-associated protein family)